MASPSPVPPFSRLDGDVDTVEALGEPRQMLRRDAGSLVDHGDRVAAEPAAPPAGMCFASIRTCPPFTP